MTKHIDLDALQALAEAATAGPWDWDHEYTPAHIAGGEIVDMEPLPYGTVYTDYDVQWDPEDLDCKEPLTIAEKVRDKDARFMRAANPQTILALIARIRELESIATTASGANVPAHQLEALKKFNVGFGPVAVYWDDVRSLIGEARTAIATPAQERQSPCAQDSPESERQADLSSTGERQVESVAATDGNKLWWLPGHPKVIPSQPVALCVVKIESQPEGK